jgi:hypothetical protein
MNTPARVGVNTLVRADINTLVRADMNTLVRAHPAQPGPGSAPPAEYL